MVRKWPSRVRASDHGRLSWLRLQISIGIIKIIYVLDVVRNIYYTKQNDVRMSAIVSLSYQLALPAKRILSYIWTLDLSTIMEISLLVILCWRLDTPHPLWPPSPKFLTILLLCYILVKIFPKVKVSRKKIFLSPYFYLKASVSIGKIVESYCKYYTNNFIDYKYTSVQSRAAIL